MHRSRAVFVCAALAMLGVAQASCMRPRLESRPSRSPVMLAVATWNMHAGRGDLARLRYELASGVLTDGVPADYILLLQEDVEPSDHGALGTAAVNGLSSFFAPVRGSAERMSGNAILSTRPLLEPRVLTLQRERQPRSAVAATIRLDAATLFVVDVHMENRLAWWRMLFSDTARGRQATELLRELPPQGDGILGGDLNTWLGPREPAWRLMLQRFSDTPPDRPQPDFRDRLRLGALSLAVPAACSSPPRP